MKTDTETSRYLSQFDNELLTMIHEQGSKLKAVKFIHDKKLGIPLRDILSHCEELQNIEYNNYQELANTAVNACKEINPDNPIYVARLLPELVKAFEDMLFIAGVHESDNKMTDEYINKIDTARYILKQINIK